MATSPNVTSLTTPIPFGPKATQYDIQFSGVDFPNLTITVQVIFYDVNGGILQQQPHTLTFADVGLDPAIEGPLFAGIITKLTAMGVIN